MREEYLDVVIYSNSIFDGTNKELISGAIGIKDKKIRYVGTKEDIEPYVDKQTNIYHYEEQFVMPGFIDAHTHVQVTIMHKNGVSLSGAKSKEEAAKRVEEYAKAHKELSFIFAYGWLPADWIDMSLPTKELLDQAVPDRAVIATHQEEHGMWLNTKALEWIGLDQSSYGIKEGYLKVDEYGELTGCMFEKAMVPVIRKCFEYNVADLTDMLFQFSDYAVPYGVTSVTDMRPLFGVDIGKDEAYENYAKEEKGIRYFTTLLLDEKNNEKVAVCKKWWEEYDHLYMVGYKDFMDGVCSAYTAALVEPYSDNADLVGDTFWTQEVLNEKIANAHKEGINVHIHCCGDRAVRCTLNAYENAIQLYGKMDNRYCIEHVEALTDEDLDRFAELDVTASMQPQHLVLMSATDEGEIYRNYFGPERDHTLFRYKDLMDSGANVAFGTDAPIVHINPLHGIYRAMTRVHDDGLPLGGWGPTQKLEAWEACKAYTYGSAYSVGLENLFGQIKEGCFADIIAIDTNLFTATPLQVRDAKNVMTMIDGKVAYRK